MAYYRPIDSLDELMDGGVRERFNDTLARIWDNVFDPNTDPNVMREITMKIKIKPSERRDAAAFRVDVIPKFAPPLSLSQTVMLSQRDNGSIIATEITNQIPGQLDVEGRETIQKVVEFNTSAN